MLQLILFTVPENNGLCEVCYLQTAYHGHACSCAAVQLLEHKHQCALLERDTKMYMSLAQNTICDMFKDS